MKRMLFVELLGGLGDLVIALPAIHAMAVSHPRAEMTVLTFAPGSDLLAADPLVHRVLLAERGDADHPARPRAALEALLAQERFDLIVTDTTYAGIGELVQRTGARVVTNLWQHPPPNQLIEERFLHILAQEEVIEPWALGMKPRLALDAADRLWAATRFATRTRRALLYPHAGMPIKIWPEARYVSLAGALRDEFGMQIVVAEGTGAEVEVSHRIAQAIGPDTVLLPQSTLRHFAAAAAYADLVIGADTGPVRVAGASGALTITLFGPSWHGRYGQRPPNINLQGYPECPERQVADFTRQRCWYAGVCPLGRRQNCVEDIGVGDVLLAADQLLQLRAWWGKPLAQETLERF